MDLLRSCFGSLLRQNLELTREEWNEHTIGRQSNRTITSGKPNEMYDCPQKFGARDNEVPLKTDKIPLLMENYTEEPRLWSKNFDDCWNSFRTSRFQLIPKVHSLYIWNSWIFCLNKSHISHGNDKLIL
ncbi:hypothetical protein QAD02_011916 [Eretmocerus hayati]|uniref:Uncharacterized protein n=1 Tax=Eretmocerus hayati TaxID=131215 RepID=A0ACC2NY58_9HYME|nr:hypothetical protein QAD02_011916 [Eretmocerus hayati]